jgi:methyl-accepting chemotaxis protein
MRSLKQKLITLTVGTAILVLIAILSITIFSIYSYSSSLLKLNSDSIINDYDKNVRNQVENALSMLDAVYKYQKDNNLSDEEGKKLARRLLRDLKYDKYGYFWADDYDGICQVMPPNTAQEGKSRINMQDARGKYLIQEILKNGRQPEGGYTEYWFPKPGETEAKRKRSYSKAFEPYKWVIGTGNYIDDIDEIIQKLKEENKIYLTRLVIIVISVAFLLSIISFIISLYFGNSIANPIIKASKVANKLAEGDLTQRLDKKYEQRDDEVGILITSINIASENLEKMFTTIATAMESLYYAIEQISQGNLNLSQRTTEQASSLEEIASTIEEATATLVQNADNAKHANDTARASYDFAQKGGDLVNSAVASIYEISQFSKKIAEITSVINEIAFQTNLLALNAAVEAARAGEQGRGFAVVAGEVRNLAQRAGAAAKEIDNLIKESLEKIESGTEQANHSGEAIKEIVHSIKNVTELISEIVAAIDEQKSGMEQVNTAVMELDSMTQQNAALVEETASASEEMSSQAMELMNLIKNFKISTEIQGDHKQLIRSSALLKKDIKNDVKINSQKKSDLDDDYDVF